jgi:hypothetical protein
MSSSDKDECPICLQTFEETRTSFDGPCNSDIPTNCTHYLCICCWEEIFERSCNCCGVKCPLCREDITEWLFSHYPLDYDSESDSDDDCEEKN